VVLATQEEEEEEEEEDSVTKENRLDQWSLEY